MSTHLLWAAGLAWLLAAGLARGASQKGFLWAAGVVSATGGAACLVGGVLLALNGRASATAVLGADNVVGRLDLRAVPLASAFLVLLGLVTLAIGCFAPRYHRPERATAVYLCAYNLAVLASLAVLVAGDVTTFLVAWESMTLACSLIILRHRRQAGVREGAFLFLALGEVGFAMVVAAFVVLATHAHSLDLSVIAAHERSIPSDWRNTAFVLALFAVPSGHVLTMTALFTALGFFVYGPQMLVAVAAADFATKVASASAVGLTGLFGYLGAAFCNLATGILVDRFGWNGALWLYAASAMVGCALLASTWNRASPLLGGKPPG